MNAARKASSRSMYKRLKFRLNWNQFARNQEAENVVKGLSKKVIIVKSPDPKIFEQAIFIVRDDYLSTQGVGQKELLKQAKQAANGYVNSTHGWHRFRDLPPAVYVAVGGCLMGLIWLCVYLLGI